MSTTTTAAWQDWVSAVKVGKKAVGNVKKLLSLANIESAEIKHPGRKPDLSQRSSKAKSL